jgi:hypothetical protein
MHNPTQFPRRPLEAGRYSARCLVSQPKSCLLAGGDEKLSTTVLHVCMLTLFLLGCQPQPTIAHSDLCLTHTRQDQTYAMYHIGNAKPNRPIQNCTGPGTGHNVVFFCSCFLLFLFCFLLFILLSLSRVHYPQCTSPIGDLCFILLDYPLGEYTQQQDDQPPPHPPTPASTAPFQIHFSKVVCVHACMHARALVCVCVCVCVCVYVHYFMKIGLHAKHTLNAHHTENIPPTPY